jgi:hypothetical protein
VSAESRRGSSILWVPETEIRVISGRVCGAANSLSGEGVVAFRARRDQTRRPRCAAGRPRWGLRGELILVDQPAE